VSCTFGSLDSFQNQIFIESVPIKNDPYRRTIEIVRIDEVEKKQLENEKIQQALVSIAALP
jgi:hypothetical protein